MGSQGGATMRVSIVSRPQPAGRADCQCCYGRERRNCVRFTVTASAGGTSDGETLYVCRSCIREAVRVATTGREREGK